MPMASREIWHVPWSYFTHFNCSPSGYVVVHNLHGNECFDDNEILAMVDEIV